MNGRVPRIFMGIRPFATGLDVRSLAMLMHLVEIFIKDPLRVVPYTLRGLVGSIDVSLDSFSALYNVLRVQMPQDVGPEDGLIYDVLRKTETLSHSAQSAKVMATKLGRSIDEMKSRGLTVEMKHVNALEGCYQELRIMTGSYRKVYPSLIFSDNRRFRNSQKCRSILPRSILKH